VILSGSRIFYIKGWYYILIMKISRKTWGQIISTTLIRTVSNTGFRMIFPLQPILMKGFNLSLDQITRMFAGQSLVGMVGPFLAGLADSRGRRTGMLAGLTLFSLGTLAIVFFPTQGGFFLFLVLSMLGKSVFDPSIQAFFGDTIPFQRRGFVLGITEISWSLAFFVGVPVTAFLMDKSGLLTPFILMTVLGVISFLVVILVIPADKTQPEIQSGIMKNIKIALTSPVALAGLGVTLLICAANQLVNGVFSVWLNESFDMQIIALGGASAVIGLAELVGEGGVSAFADRISIKRAVLLGLIGSVLSSLILPFLGGSTWGAFLGLFLFYLAFEFTIVSLIPLMTGVIPEARGTVMALNIASANLGRGLGSLFVAPLYLSGIWLNAAAAGVVNLLAILVLRYVVVQKDS
jgi:predicted MFS family arabinose efflux permease